MRLKMLWVLAIVAGATWGSASWADEPAPAGNWLSRWFTFGKQADDKDHFDVARQALPAPAIDQRARAEAAFHRRCAICLKLQSIANDTKDEALRREAEQLEMEVWQHYYRLTANVPQ